jgi:hypothetical protein
MKYEATKKISPAEAKVFNTMLEATEQLRPYKRDAVLGKINARFNNGFEVDLKVCNGDAGPWIDAVLFDPNGIEVAVDQPADGPIEGEYNLQPNTEDEYILTVVVG